jgi:hydrophobic/amphiphilic exporter-1 (mainly G- bacteria), HAE1 family
MKNIVRFAVNNPVSIWMLTLAVALLGIISLSRLGTDLFPDINTPRLFIEIKAGERSPEEMETRFVENLEALSVRQKGVAAVKSDVSVGAAVVTVEYNYGQNMDEAFLDLQKAIAPYEQSSGADEIVITRFDPNSSPIIEAAFVSENNQNMADLRKIAEKQIVADIIRLEGIADVRLHGDLQQQVVVSVNPSILEVNGLTSSSITSAIEAYNRNVSGGYIEESGQRFIIKGTGNFSKPDDLLNLVVGYRSTTGATTAAQSENVPVPILLGEVATVSMGTSEPENIVTLNGVQCLGVSIYKETGYNTVKAVKTLISEFEKTEQRLPGFKLVIVSDQGSVISAAVGEVQQSALLGILLAVIVLFVFLRRIGITMIVSIAIPISVIATFNLMYFNGLTLNIMTLGGLALGAGMLVDNAIVAIENIFRHIEQGKTVREAAIEGVSNVGGALVASTLTTIVVFLPVVYLHGASGELFKDQAWTVAFSLLSSLFVAILLIPVMVQQFFSDKTQKAKSTVKTFSFNKYGGWLNSILDYRNMVLIASLALVLGTAWLFTKIGSEFMPSYQSNELTLKMKMPAGTALERTAGVAGNISHIITEFAGEKATHIYSRVGPGSNEIAGQTGGNNTGTLKILFTKEESTNIPLLIANLEDFFKDMQGLEIEYHQESTGLAGILGTDEAPFEVQVAGSDLEQLMALTQEVKGRLLQEPDLLVTYTSFEEGAPEVAVKIDRYRAGVFNVDVSSIMTQISQFLQGNDAGSMELNGELVDIRLKMPDISLAQLQNLRIISGSNQYLLRELAEISPGSSPAEISRVNQTRTGKIQGYPIGNKPFSTLISDVRQNLSDIELPQGYQIRIAGEELKREESFDNLLFALILSVILVYMVMAAQFESLVHPFTILLSIPLAGAGVVILFFVTGNNFNIMALIGVVMLGGIAVNNAILLVDAINRNKWAGMDRRRAIIAAGQQRIRPILMTSVTTILALLPLTFGFGESASLRAPMAMAVIGGLVSSTLLTLVVIPCLYDLFDRLLPATNVEPANIDQ